MIAGYHHKLAADLTQDMTKYGRKSCVGNERHLLALGKGDALTADERRKVREQLARYTGLRPEVVENNNLRSTSTFTHELLLTRSW